LVLVLLTLLAAALRFSTLGVQSYWGDEGFTVAIVGHALGGVLPGVRHTESTPPLYYFVAWGWSQVFGAGPVGLRSLSALFGTLTVPVSFGVGYALFSRRVGLICAAFVSCSPVLVWYSQEARSYSLLLFLGALSLWFFVRTLQGNERYALWWAVTAALALATHYFALFTIAPEAAWLLFTGRHNRLRWIAVLIPAVMFAALVPLLLYQDHHVARPWTAGYGLTNALTGVTQGALVGPTWTWLTHRVGVAALALIVLGALVLLVRDKAQLQRAHLPIALLAVSVGLPFALAVVGTNYVVIRNLILAVPLGYAIVAAGLAVAPDRRMRWMLVGAFCGVSFAISVAVALTPSMQRNDWRDATRALAAGRAARVWVFLDRFDSKPVSSIYVPRTVPLGSSPVGADEIDLLGRASFPNVTPPSVVPGFTLVERRLIGGLWISRFRAPRLIELSGADFRGFDAWVVAQRAG
jgi:mannosyltransferase